MHKFCSIPVLVHKILTLCLQQSFFFFFRLSRIWKILERLRHISHTFSVLLQSSTPAEKELISCSRSPWLFSGPSSSSWDTCLRFWISKSRRASSAHQFGSDDAGARCELCACSPVCLSTVTRTWWTPTIWPFALVRRWCQYQMTRTLCPARPTLTRSLRQLSSTMRPSSHPSVSWTGLCMKSAWLAGKSTGECPTTRLLWGENVCFVCFI